MSAGRRLALAAAATVAALAAAGCSHDPDLTGCKAEMHREITISLARGYDVFTQRPAVCDGVTDVQLEQMAGQIMGGQP